MTSNGHCFVEWKEQFISQERGNRVVHYFLKDSAGESTLAVVGTERSVRHMFYVVAEEFVRVYGAENSIHAGFKWRSRREVVDWLTSMLSKKHLQSDRSKSPQHDLAQALESVKHQMNGFGTQELQGRLSNLNGHSSEIVWSGLAWACGKQLKHYRAFCRTAITITVQSFVFVLGKGENPYIAYLEDMYEDKRGQKKVKVRWFHHNQEVKGVVSLRNFHPKEVFMTQNSQVISAECVDGPATVLTREHYEECLSTFPNALSARVHLCLRQFRNNKVKPFDVRKLHGYFDQPILACLNSNFSPGADSTGHADAGEEDEDLSPYENAKPGAKRTRSSRSCETFTTDHLRVSANQMLSFSPSYLNFKRVKYGMSGKRMRPFKHVVFQSWHSLLFKVDEKIELLCQDSGIRGCWFRCTVLQVSKKQIKVQYDDVQDEDEYGNLEEWVPAFKLAAPDKLGTRCPGRPIMRPTPPLKELAEPAYEVGSAVDAWWSDGWWEGVVTGINSSNGDSLQVYFPGENNNLRINKKDLRISRDWVEGQWVDIQARPDIFPVISPIVSADTKISTSSIVAMDTKSDDTEDMKSNGVAAPTTEVPISPMIDNIEETDTDTGIATANSPDNLPEDMDCDDGGREPPLTHHEADGDILVEIEVQDKVDGDAAIDCCGKLETEVTSEENCKGI